MANEFIARKGLIVSGSTVVTNAVTASFFRGDGSNLTNITATSASFSTTASFANTTPYSGLIGVPSGIVSSSGQVSYTGLSGIPSGIVSGSTASSPSQGTVRVTINGVNTDVDTGLQTGDSPSFAGLTVDTNILYVDATNDRVGIGTVSPAYGLVVNNPNTSNTGTVYINAVLNSSGKGLVIDSTTRTATDNNILALEVINRTGGNTLAATVAGNVGIGTTSPGEKLQVNGSVFVNLEESGFVVDAGGNKRVGLMKYSGFEGALTHATSSVLRFGRTNQTSVTTGSFTEEMRIDQYGKVGIGGITPTSKLHVAGGGAGSQISVGSNTAGETGAIYLYGTSTKYNWSIGAQQTVDNGFEITPSTAVGGTTFTTPAVTILATGNTGIGTTTPAAKLHVQGNVSASSYTGSLLSTNGVVSSSGQVSYLGLSNIPSGILSSSTQFNLLTGTSASFAATAPYSGLTGVPSGIVSGSTASSPSQGTVRVTINGANTDVDTGLQTGDSPSFVTITSTQATGTAPLTVSSRTLVTNLNADLLDGLDSTSFAITGSNTFTANQTISGSLTITQNLNVLGSSSISYVSQSTLNIGTNLITVNVQNPSIRFGGLAVIDSGSSPQRSGSLLFDSVNDQWIFVHQNQTSPTSSVVLMGPQTYNNIGNETNLTNNYLLKSVNAEHVGDSQVFDNGTNVGIGTSSPSYKLDVNGNGRFTSAIYLGGNFDFIDPSSNSGFMTIGSNQPIRFTNASSTEYVRITTAGNVGIGTSSPGVLLDITGSTPTARVVGAAGTTPKLTLSSAGVTAWSFRTSGSDSSFRLDQDGTDRITVLSGGNVGIGTTTPGAKLHIQGNVSASSYTGSLSGQASSVANTLTISSPLSGTSYNGSAAVTIALASGYGDTQNPFGSKTANHFLAAPNGSAGAPTFRAIVAADIPTLNQNTTGTASNITAYTINQNLGTANSPSFAGLTVDTNTLFVDATNDRVGIGTTTPAYKLHIYDNIASTPVRVENIASNGYSGVQFFNNSGAISAHVGFGNASVGNTGLQSKAYFGTVSNTDSVITTNDTVRITIKNDGNVGIGTTSPTVALQVHGNGTLNSYRGVIRIINTDTQQWSGLAFPDGVASDSTANNYYFIGRGASLANRNLSFHIPRQTDYGSGGEPKFLFASSGADTLMTLEANTATLYVKGNVGIGTASPAEKLHVDAGSGLPIRAVSSGFSGIEFHNTNGTWKVYVGTETGGGGARYNSADSVHNWYNNGSAAMRLNSTGLGIGTTSPNRTLSVNGSANITGSLDVTGAFTAQTKSFKINHQTIPNKSLVYGVLEGPEHAVYVRGRLTDENTIHLPTEWEWLIDENSITVQLTPIGSHQKLYVDSVSNKQILVKVDALFDRRIDCYYLVHATRKDVEPLQTVQ